MTPSINKSELINQPSASIVPPLPDPTYPDFGMPEKPKGAPDVDIRPDGEGNTANLPSAKDSPVQPPAEGTPRILIGVPILDISYEFFISFLKFWTELSVGEHGYEVGYHFEYRKPVHMAEESLVRTAMYNKCTHILLMDDDIFDVTRADFEKLLNADKDMIGGVMYASKFPHAMCAFRRYDKSKRVIDMPSDNSLFRLYEIPCQCTKCNASLSHWDAKFCPACGAEQDNLIQDVDLQPFPFTLIKLSVFDRISEPWFHCTNKYPTDSWFADKLEEAGIDQYCHMGVRLNHNGVSDTTKPYLMQMGQAKSKNDKAIVEITPEQMDLHQRLLYHRMQEVEERIKPKPVFVEDGKAKANEESLGAKQTTLVTK